MKKIVVKYRRSWGPLHPATKVKPSGKIYKRAKARTYERTQSTSDPKGVA